MDQIGCECTQKSVNNLENAIKHLLNRGREVNQILENEKKKHDQKKNEEVAAIRGVPTDPFADTCFGDSEVSSKRTPSNLQMIESPNEAFVPLPRPPSVIDVPTLESNKPRLLYNKKTKTSEQIDFDIPSLDDETSEDKKKTKNSKPCSGSTVTTTTTLSETIRSIKLGGKEGITLHDSYSVDVNGKTEKWPAKINLIQCCDGSLDVTYQFLDPNGKETMKLNLNMNGEKISKLNIDGKKFQELC